MGGMGSGRASHLITEYERVWTRVCANLLQISWGWHFGWVSFSGNVTPLGAAWGDNQPFPTIAFQLKGWIAKVEYNILDKLGVSN